MGSESGGKVPSRDQTLRLIEAIGQAHRGPQRALGSALAGSSTGGGAWPRLYDLETCQRKSCRRR